MKQNRIRPIDRRRRLALECLETRLPLTLDFAHGSEQPVAAPHPGAQHLLPLTSQVVSEGPTHVDKNPRTVPTKRPRPMPEPEGEFSPSIPSGSSRPAADVPTPTNGPSRPSSEPIPSRTPASSLDGSTGKGGSNLLGNPGSSLPSRPEANFRGEASGAISPNGPSVAVSETVPGNRHPIWHPFPQTQYPQDPSQSMEPQPSARSGSSAPSRSILRLV